MEFSKLSNMGEALEHLLGSDEERYPELGVRDAMLEADMGAPQQI